jgi:hypothetical protein
MELIALQRLIDYYYKYPNESRGSTSYSESPVRDLHELNGVSRAEARSPKETLLPKTRSPGPNDARRSTPSIANNTQHNADIQSLPRIYLYLRDLHFRSALLTTTHNYNGLPLERNSVHRDAI